MIAEAAPSTPKFMVVEMMFDYGFGSMSEDFKRFIMIHLGEKTSEIQLIMAFLTRNRRNFRLNCQFSTFHVTIRLYK